MKIQRQQSLLIIDKAPILREIPYGQAVQYGEKTLLKLKPTRFLLNSNIVADVLNRGDCLVCNLELGTLYIMKGDEPVTFIDCHFVINE